MILSYNIYLRQVARNFQLYQLLLISTLIDSPCLFVEFYYLDALLYYVVLQSIISDFQHNEQSAETVIWEKCDALV